MCTLLAHSTWSTEEKLWRRVNGVSKKGHLLKANPAPPLGDIRNFPGKRLNRTSLNGFR